MKTSQNSLAKALALPCAALIAFTTAATTAATPAMAQSIEGDQDITVTVDIVDQDLGVDVAVITAPDFGRITKPRALGGGSSLETCEYEVFSDGTREVRGDLIDPGGFPSSSSELGCAFLGAVAPPVVTVTCPADQRAIITGSAQANGIEARIAVGSMDSSDFLIDCKTGDGVTFSSVRLSVSRDADFGAQQIVVPLEVTFE